MMDEKEIAYRYDLFIAPEWRGRFDDLLDENVVVPAEGEILEVNCGTGGHELEIAARLKDKGEVVGVDPSPEKLDLARAKALVARLKNVRFEQAPSSDLPFASGAFDAVIGDASLVKTPAIEPMFAEMIRVAKPGPTVTIMLATHGSFDEFFSIYWEALMEEGLVDQVWDKLEALIREHITVSDAEAMASRLGLNEIQSVTSKVVFEFATGADFIESPLISDAFISDWLSIVPADRREDVIEAVKSIIERERHGMSFEVSVKATLLTGKKRPDE